jgi:hypothetical protein
VWFTHLNWDGLLEGLVGAIVSSVATIAAAFVTVAYAKNEINKTAPTAKIPPLAARISSLFGILEIGEARQFRVESDHSYSHPHFDLCVSVGSTKVGTGWSATFPKWVKLQLPGASEPERYDAVTVGWCRVFAHTGYNYRITLVTENGIYLTFQLRLLGADAPAAGTATMPIIPEL